MTTDTTTHSNRLFEFHPDPTWTVDAQGALLTANRAAQAEIGQRARLEELFVPEDLEKVRDWMMRAEWEQTPQNGRASLLGTAPGRGDAHCTLIPASEGGGSVIFFLMVRVVEETPDAETLEQLRETQELLEAVFRHSREAMGMFDVDGTILRMNDAFVSMFGYSREELIGRKVPVTPPGALQEEVYRHFDAILNQAVPYVEFETVKLHKSGHLLDVQVTLSPIKKRDGVIVAIHGISRDLTDAKKTQTRLIQAEKLSIAGQLAAGIAHEIRNPLTALKGFVQLMEGGASFNPHYLQVMGAELNRIEGITNELLVLAKPQANQMTRRELASLVQEVVTLFESLANLRNVELTADLEQGLPEMNCDSNQLKQVFINFLKNALEAMPCGGRIDIVLRRDGHRAHLAFADLGCGIEPDVLARLGEPFLTTKENGTGLGFMVCKQIIENHRGEVRVESEVGKGTTVGIWLPL
ncbi:PAS domain S-box protein [Tumebacillus flagellatus]|nr:PAS domain S-box protein [Tumebacillus flagellatus]